VILGVLDRCRRLQYRTKQFDALSQPYIQALASHSPGTAVSTISNCHVPARCRKLCLD
jgi:hypothetical protein